MGFPNYENETHPFEKTKTKHHRLGNTGPLVRDPQPGPYTYLISSFLTPSPSWEAEGSDCRVWKMWIQVSALPLAGCLTWGKSEPSLNLGFFIHEMRNNNRSCVAKIINIILKMGKQQRTAVRLGSGVWIPLLLLTDWPLNKLLNLSVCLTCKGGEQLFFPQWHTVGTKGVNTGKESWTKKKESLTGADT